MCRAAAAAAGGMVVWWYGSMVVCAWQDHDRMMNIHSCSLSYLRYCRLLLDVKCSSRQWHAPDEGSGEGGAGDGRGREGRGRKCGTLALRNHDGISGGTSTSTCTDLSVSFSLSLPPSPSTLLRNYFDLPNHIYTCNRDMISPQDKQTN